VVSEDPGQKILRLLHPEQSINGDTQIATQDSFIESKEKTYKFKESIAREKQWAPAKCSEAKSPGFLRGGICILQGQGRIWTVFAGRARN
jgi:hypothetical protein